MSRGGAPGYFPRQSERQWGQVDQNFAGSRDRNLGWNDVNHVGRGSHQRERFAGNWGPHQRQTQQHYYTQQQNYQHGHGQPWHQGHTEYHRQPERSSHDYHRGYQDRRHQEDSRGWQRQDTKSYQGYPRYSIPGQGVPQWSNPGGQYSQNRRGNCSRPVQSLVHICTDTQGLERQDRRQLNNARKCHGSGVETNYSGQQGARRVSQDRHQGQEKAAHTTSHPDSADNMQGAPVKANQRHATDMPSRSHGPRLLSKGPLRIPSSSASLVSPPHITSLPSAAERDEQTVSASAGGRPQLSQGMASPHHSISRNVGMATKSPAGHIVHASQSNRDRTTGTTNAPTPGKSRLTEAHRRELFIESHAPDPAAEQDALLDLLGDNRIFSRSTAQDSRRGSSDNTLSDSGESFGDLATKVANISGDVSGIRARVDELAADISPSGKKSPRSSQQDKRSEQGFSQSSQYSYQRNKGSFDDSMYYDNPIDLSVSDDDDELPGADLILPRSQRARIQSTPSTPFVIPKRESVPDYLEEDLAPSTTDVSRATANLDRLKMNLDTLLAERMKEEENNREIEAMEEELQIGLKSGGINKFVPSDSEDDLMPEHQKQLRELVICEKVIMDHPPGERVFQIGQFQYLFTHASLTLKDMGFMPGDSYIDNCLTTSPQDQILELLMDGVIQMCFDSIASPNIFLSWVFHLMSVHPNSLTIHSCNKLLYDVLHREEGAGSTWAPSPTDIARILVNLGAKLSEICSRNEILQIDMEDLLFDQEKENIEVPRPVIIQHGGIFLENLQFVLQTITNAIITRTDQYSSNEIFAMCLMIFRTALDKELNDDCLKQDLQVFFSAAFNAFSDEEWPRKVTQFCEILPTLSDHHHNCVHLVHVLPPVERGHLLQRHLAYSMLQKFLYPETERPVLQHIMVQNLFRVVQRIEVKNNENFYQLSSIIRLIDLCVGNENLKVSEKEDLKRLSDMVRTLMGDVRELINVLDRTLVKDIMVRLTSKWSFMMQNMATKQRTLFAYTQRQDGDSQNIEEISQSQETEDELDQSDLEPGVGSEEEDSLTADHVPTTILGADSSHPINDSLRSNELESSQLPDIEPPQNLLDEDDPDEIQRIVESQKEMIKNMNLDDSGSELPELDRHSQL